MKSVAHQRAHCKLVANTDAIGICRTTTTVVRVVVVVDLLLLQPVLLQNVRMLTEKISVLALMELVFKTPSDERAIPFSVIAKHTKLAAQNEVELLVMKALSLKLVKGAIDQVEEVVAFTWVQPRVLDIAQV
jgi:hypothetical protein